MFNFVNNWASISENHSREYLVGKNWEMNITSFFPGECNGGQN